MINWLWKASPHSFNHYYDTRAVLAPSKDVNIGFAVSLRPVDKSPKLAELQQGLLNNPRSLSGGVHIPACHSPPALLTSVSLIEGLSL